MGYQVYERNGRGCGYGVPSICDHPDCNTRIDRGVSYCCGDEPGGGEFGCGLYFCYEHQPFTDKEDGPLWLCERCEADAESFTPKPDLPEWNEWKLTDESWRQWRNENPAEVARLREVAYLSTPTPTTGEDA